jgi:hypothetical protein
VNVQFKELEQPEPLAAGQVAVVQKPEAEVVERVPAPGASSSAGGQGVYFSASAPRAHPLVVFPAEFQQIIFCRIFTFYYFFIGS